MVTSARLRLPSDFARIALVLIVVHLALISLSGGGALAKKYGLVEGFSWRWNIGRDWSQGEIFAYAKWAGEGVTDPEGHRHNDPRRR